MKNENMNLDNLDKFLEKVPMHYGEAVQLYPWIKETDCEDYEWCNRTSLENSIWLIEQLELQLSKLRQGDVSEQLEHNDCHNCGDLLYPNSVSGYCNKCM